MILSINKILIQNTLHYDSEKRFNIYQVKNSSFLLQPCYLEEAINDIQERFEEIIQLYT